MRYQLPIYPLLAMMAAWVVFEFAGLKVGTFKRFNLSTVLAGILGLTVVVLTTAWAFAFHSIYLRDEPRIAASRWIFQNVRGPINLHIETAADGNYNQPVPFPTGVYLQSDKPYQTSFIPKSDGVLNEVSLAHVVSIPDLGSPSMLLTVWQNLADPQPLASGLTTQASDATSSLVNFDQAPALIANQTYHLKFEMIATGGLINICGPLRFSIQRAQEHLGRSSGRNI